MARPRPVRRQHTAARTYLKGFANTAGQVVMHARNGVVEPRNISSASVIRDFYTFVDEEGKPSDAVEHWLGEEIEDQVASVLRQLPAASELHHDWLDPLSSFLVTSLVRTGTLRAFMEQIDDHIRPLLVLHEHAKRAEIDLLALSDDARRRLLNATRDALARLSDDPTENRRSQLRTMLRKIDEWTVALRSWNWEIVHSASPQLITGDAPVAVLGALPLLGWAGVLPADATAALPISPTTVVIATPHPLIGDGQLTDQLAARLNSELVRNCYRAVFRHPEMPWPPDLYVPAQTPALPDPTITWRGSLPGHAATLPASYPAVLDQTIRGLLDDLGAADTVE